MALFVDPLMNHGWVLRGRAVANCHLFTGRLALVELPALAEQIGMRRACLPAHASVPHYELTPSRRRDAIALGTLEVDPHQAVEIRHHSRFAALSPSVAPQRRALPLKA